tara:strand:- start:1394 stop:1567 length:174 start_codon:yes stop_codon:yes gene_type:complete
VKTAKSFDLAIEKENYLQNAKALATGTPERTRTISCPTCHSRAVRCNLKNEKQSRKI